MSHFELLDAHFHLNYLKNPLEKINKALAQGVVGGLVAGVWNKDTVELVKVYLSNQTKDRQQDTIFFQDKSFEMNFSSNQFKCFLAHGLHPAYVHTHWLNGKGQKQVKQILEDKAEFKKLLIENKNYIWAIGETGFDLSRQVLQDKISSCCSKEQILELQEEAFDFCVDQALELNLPLVIHSRSAWNFSLNKIKEAKSKGIVNVMIHCYGGPAEELKKLEDLGVYCSFGGVATWKNAKKVRQSFERCAPHLRLLETDSPDLLPEFENEFVLDENEPSTLRYIAEQLAPRLNLSVNDFARQVNENFINFLRNIYSQFNQ